MGNDMAAGRRKMNCKQTLVIFLCTVQFFTAVFARSVATKQSSGLTDLLITSVFHTGHPNKDLLSQSKPISFFLSHL